MKRTLFILLNFLFLAFVGWLIATHNRPYALTDALGESHPAIVEYKEFQKKYNDENFLYFMVVSEESLLTDHRLFSLDDRITHYLLTVPDLNKVTSISTSRYFEYKDDRITINPFFKNNDLSEKGRELLLDSPMWRKTFLDVTGKSMIVSIEINEGISASREKEVIRKITDFGSELQKSDSHLRVYVLGTKIATHSFNYEMFRQQAYITPLAFLILAALIFFVLRSWVITSIAFYYMVIVYAATSVIIFCFEKGLSPYTQFALLFVFIVAMEDFIHLFAAFNKEKGVEPRQAIIHARKEVIWPCLLTSLAEAFGFAGLSLSGIEPVRNFGIYSTLGVLLAFVICFYFLPLIVDVFSIRPATVIYFDFGSPISAGFISWVGKFKGLIIATFLLVTLGVGIFTKDLHVEDNLYDKFRKGHPLSQALKAFTDNFQFTGSIDVSIPNGRTHFLTREQEQALNQAMTEIEGHPNVSAVRGLTTYLSYLRHIFNRPIVDKENDFARDPFLRNTLDIAKRRKYLRDYWPEYYDETKVNVRIKSVSSNAVVDTLTHIKSVFEGKGIPYSIGGYTKVRVVMLDEIVWGFIYSFLFCFISIFGIFLVIYQSFSWALIAMLPNIIPAILMAGAIGFFKIPVEDSLVLTISILIGVAVNDTIHFVHGTKRNLARGGTIQEAILRTMEHSGHAVIGTNIVFLLILPLFFLSQIDVFFRMGFFLMVSLVVAMICDMFLTPALLLKFKANHERVA